MSADAVQTRRLKENAALIVAVRSELDDVIANMIAAGERPAAARMAAEQSLGQIVIRVMEGEQLR